MVPVKNKPIIIHIMSHYAKYGFKDFILATGFKHNIIKNYFKKIFEMEYSSGEYWPQFNDRREE